MEKLQFLPFFWNEFLTVKKLFSPKKKHKYLTEDTLNKFSEPYFNFTSN